MKDNKGQNFMSRLKQTNKNKERLPSIIIACKFALWPYSAYQ